MLRLADKRQTAVVAYEQFAGKEVFQAVPPVANVMRKGHESTREIVLSANSSLFDDMMASIEKLGNTAALALGRELYRAEDAGGGFVLIHCARTIIDRAIKSQSIIAVQEEMDKLRRVAAACEAGLAAPLAPKALAKPEPKMNPDQDPIAACRLRMLWMTELGNSPEDCADSLRYNPPQSVTEEQGLLDAVRIQLEWEKTFTSAR